MGRSSPSAEDSVRRLAMPPGPAPPALPGDHVALPLETGPDASLAPPRARCRSSLTFQWQDGKKVIVWPDELAPGKPRFPTPPWGQRQ